MCHADLVVIRTKVVSIITHRYVQCKLVDSIPSQCSSGWRFKQPVRKVFDPWLPQALMISLGHVQNHLFLLHFLRRPSMLPSLCQKHLFMPLHLLLRLRRRHSLLRKTSMHYHTTTEICVAPRLQPFIQIMPNTIIMIETLSPIRHLRHWSIN